MNINIFKVYHIAYDIKKHNKDLFIFMLHVKSCF